MWSGTVSMENGTVSMWIEWDLWVMCLTCTTAAISNVKGVEAATEKYVED